ncbi:MAG: RNA 2',3'-cyclic phosphodiesterase [Candidatus Omnitrophica bacterium]|nr:RNA 2',3'-cyclic phosphodiesterase [Candidatus Omnitrophota bacterium]
MRTFIAIDLPENLKTKLSQIQKDLETDNLKFKWVEPDNIHLTLKFLGEIDEDQLLEIKKVVAQTTDQIKTFELTAEGLGFFPNQKNPRIFLTNLKNSEPLRLLVTKLENNLTQLGFPIENKFKAHLTLARIKSQENIDLLIEKTKAIRLKERFSVGKITIYKSNLTASGPIYTIIASSPLTD